MDSYGSCSMVHEANSWMQPCLTMGFWHQCIRTGYLNVKDHGKNREMALTRGGVLRIHQMNCGFVASYRIFSDKPISNVISNISAR
uniref:Uncharacterized protein n=1 Tax=Anguilla anguilla TaxID=7936 RepID=A0A0E9WGU1_ANGAN